jgi:transposase
MGRRSPETFLTEMLDPAAEPPSTLSARTPLLIMDLRLEWSDLDPRIKSAIKASISS